MMYEYSERVVAPSVVEFYVPTPQGHRIVRVFLDSHNPRITAFNETDSTRTPATLFKQEIDTLIDRARSILNFPATHEKESSNEDRRS